MPVSQRSPMGRKGNALVVGGLGAIGSACVAALAREGYHVAVASRSAPIAFTMPVAIDAIATDVTEPSSVRHLTDHLERSLGSLSLVVIAAGRAEIEPPHSGRRLSDELEVVRRMMDVHVGGTLVLASALFPLLQAGAGCLVSITSRAAARVDPRFLGYGAAKRAQEHVVGALAQEWRESSVDLYCVAPSRVDSPLLESLGGSPEGALRAEDVAHAALDLAARRPQSGTLITLRAGRPPLAESLVEVLTRG